VARPTVEPHRFLADFLRDDLDRLKELAKAGREFMAQAWPAEQEAYRQYL
jgi:hypothetical protein